MDLTAKEFSSVLEICSFFALCLFQALQRARLVRGRLARPQGHQWSLSQLICQQRKREPKTVGINELGSHGEKGNNEML